MWPRWGLPYESGGDARRLALGCKWQILVSLRVFGMESYYRNLQNAVTLTTQNSSLGGHFKLEPHPHWSPLRFKFSTSIPGTFIWESPPGNVAHRNIL